MAVAMGNPELHEVLKRVVDALVQAELSPPTASAESLATSQSLAPVPCPWRSDLQPFEHHVALAAEHTQVHSISPGVAKSKPA